MLGRVMMPLRSPCTAHMCDLHFIISPSTSWFEALTEEPLMDQAARVSDPPSVFEAAFLGGCGCGDRAYGAYGAS